MNPVKWLSSIPCKSLNDNPRVKAEARIWALENRRTWVQNIRGPRMFFNYSEGYVSAARFGYVSKSKIKQADKLIFEINKEISSLQAFLNSF